VIALTTSLLMWQSEMWNGQEEAFRMFTIVGVVFLGVVQREPTLD
jgi:predicted small integral membrane protein